MAKKAPAKKAPAKKALRRRRPIKEQVTSARPTETAGSRAPQRRSVAQIMIRGTPRDFC